MKKYKAAMAIIAAFGCVGFGYYEVESISAISIDENIFYPVTYVIDGDTFKARIGRNDITVRLLGINTPETLDRRKPVECYGKEASDESKMILGGHTVELKFNPNRERNDKYGRYLAYAYREDGLFVNAYLLENGFAKEYTFKTPYTLQKEFREIEKRAKEQGKGLWIKCA